jgi:hypothetical protein
MAALPNNIFASIYGHYVQQKPIDAIAKETGHDGYMIGRWVKNGIALLKIFSEDNSIMTHTVES